MRSRSLLGGHFDKIYLHLTLNKFKKPLILFSKPLVDLIRQYSVKHLHMNIDVSIEEAAIREFYLLFWLYLNTMNN